MHLLEFGGGRSQLASKIVASEFVSHVPSALFPDVLQVSEFRLIESHSADLSTRQRCDHKVVQTAGWTDLHCAGAEFAPMIRVRRHWLWLRGDWQISQSASAIATPT